MKKYFISSYSIAARLVLAILFCLPVWGGNVQAQNKNPEAYVVFDESNGVLTFKYDGDRPEGAYSIEVKPYNEIPGWITEHKNEITKVIFDDSFAEARPTSCYKWFYSCYNLKSIEGIVNLNTINVKNMGYMFWSCSELTNLDVSGFDTGNVKNMRGVFCGCGKLTSLDISKFSTQSVTDMNRMFAGCYGLTTLDVSHFNTENVTDMQWMFKGCSGLTTLNVSNFYTYRVTNMQWMFYDCSGLKSLDLSNFYTYNVTDMSDMFSGCSELTTLDIPNFYPFHVTNMSSMFSRCSKLTTLDISKFNTAKNVMDMSYMFSGCSGLTALDVSKIHTENVMDMSYMFSGCSGLTTLDVSNFNTNNVSSMSYMFSGCSGLTTLDLSNFNTENVTRMEEMFKNCSGLTTLDLSNFDTENVTNMSDMFNGCSSLTTIYSSDYFVTTSETEGSGMFTDCTALKGASDYNNNKTGIDMANYHTGYFSLPAGGSIIHEQTPKAYAVFNSNNGELTFKYDKNKAEGSYSISGWRKLKADITKIIFDDSFAKVKQASCNGWFAEMQNLKSIDGFENFNTTNVTDMSHMFHNCSALTTLDLSKLNTNKVTSMYGMLSGCSGLTTIDLSNMNTESVTDMGFMFDGCTGLKSLDISNFNTVNTMVIAGLFRYCKSLASIYIGDKFVTTNVTYSYDEFLDCTALKGACEYNENKRSIEKANYYTGYLKSYYKIGDEKHSICGEDLKVDNLELIDGKDFMTVIPFEASVASYNRTIKEGTSWATLCLPFEVSLADKNFRAFKLLKVANDVVELEEINANIDAGNPVIIKMTNGATSINIAENNKTIVKDVQASEKVYGCQLVGLYTQKMFDKNVDNNCFIVKGNKLMNPAKLLANENVASVGSKGFRAYMQTDTPATSMAKAYSIGLDNETTAIGQLETTADEKAEYYDLQGNRLNDLQKGVNIVKRGNKTTKVIIK